MNEQNTREQHLAREKALHRYMDAFERNDFEVMSQVLAQAEQDADLETLIWEVHAAYAAEEEYGQREYEVEQVRQLLRQHLPSGLETPLTLEEMPPLMVSDVIARMQADEAVRGSVKQELQSVTQRLRQSNQALPEQLGLHGVRTLFAQLGVQASKQLQKLFSQTALFLTSGRQQGMAQLAATRRQHEQLYQKEVSSIQEATGAEQQPSTEEKEG
jgi:hypothetical protein